MAITRLRQSITEDREHAPDIGFWVGFTFALVWLEERGRGKTLSGDFGARM